MMPLKKISDIQLSIALATMNRPDSLNQSLEILRSQSYQPYEIVISDDSHPSFQNGIKEIAQRWHCQYTLGPGRGLYANRNHSALACKGTHIRTMDDDHRFGPSHLENCVHAMLADPQAIWTTGERGFVDGQHYLTLATATQLHPSGVGEAVADINDNWSISDGSTIYPSEIFRRGHRWIEWYGFGSSYLEFGAYLYKHGYKSRCIPEALVDHYAEGSTLKRMSSKNRELQVVESQLFASLCFNLYFRPNKLLALKYLAACWEQSGFSHRLVQRLPVILARVHERWGR